MDRSTILVGATCSHGPLLDGPRNRQHGVEAVRTILASHARVRSVCFARPVAG